MSRTARCMTAPRTPTIVVSRFRPSTGVDVRFRTLDWASNSSCIRSTPGGRRDGDDDGLRRSIDPLGCRIVPSLDATRNRDRRVFRCGVRRCCRISPIDCHSKAADDRRPTAMKRQRRDLHSCPMSEIVQLQEISVARRAELVPLNRAVAIDQPCCPTMDIVDGKGRSAWWNDDSLVCKLHNPREERCDLR